MKIERVAVCGVMVDKGHRSANPEVVASIAASMRLIGQLQPITVYEVDGNAQLVAGRHRLEAAEFLGWDFIDAIFVDGDQIDYRLREISENLHRAELTARERAEQIAEWAELVEQKAKVGQLVHPGGKQPTEKGISKAARELGIGRKEVERAVKIASITPEAKEAAREAGIDDNQSKLLAVAKEPPEKQKAKVVELAAAPLNHFETQEQWMAAMMRLWNRASKEWREEFLSRIDRPLMDSRFG